MNKAFLSLDILFLFIFSACSFAPKYNRPVVRLPEKKVKTKVNFELSYWWLRFHDKELNYLIKTALRNNDDLLLAYEKINEIRAAYNLASASLYPSLNASAKAYRIKNAELLDVQDTFNDFSLLASLSYDLDLFGKLKNQKKAELARLLAQKYYAKAIRINLISEVAITYFKICEVNKEIDILHRIIAQSLKALSYREREYKNGLINKIVIQQERLALDNDKIYLESLIEQRGILYDRLSFLLGKEPRDIFLSRYDFIALPNPLSLPPFLPSTVLEKRPDILQAQEMLKAANFEIGVARARYFPDISLTGVLGFESRELSNLLKHASSFWNIGGNISTPIFDFGRIKSNIDIAKSQKKQAIFRYIRTVKNAFKEIHDVLLHLSSIKRQIEIQQDQINSYKKILCALKVQYQNGLVSYIKIIYAQKDLEYALIKLTSLKSRYLSQQVLLYKALGGGW